MIGTRNTVTLASMAVAAIAILSAEGVGAQVAYIPGNNPEPGEENVLLNKGDTGAIVTGSNIPTSADSRVDAIQINRSTAVGGLAGTSSLAKNGRLEAERAKAKTEVLRLDAGRLAKKEQMEFREESAKPIVICVDDTPGVAVGRAPAAVASTAAASMQRSSVVLTPT